MELRERSLQELGEYEMDKVSREFNRKAEEIYASEEDIYGMESGSIPGPRYPVQIDLGYDVLDRFDWSSRGDFSESLRDGSAVISVSGYHPELSPGDIDVAQLDDAMKDVDNLPRRLLWVEEFLELQEKVDSVWNSCSGVDEFQPLETVFHSVDFSVRDPDRYLEVLRDIEDVIDDTEMEVNGYLMLFPDVAEGFESADDYLRNRGYPPAGRSLGVQMSISVDGRGRPFSGGDSEFYLQLVNDGDEMVLEFPFVPDDHGVREKMEWLEVGLDELDPPLKPLY